MRKPRPVTMVVVFSILVQLLGLAPINAASPPSLPDPPARPVMPNDVRLSQPDAAADHRADQNHVRELTETEIAAVEAVGGDVVTSADGQLEVDVATAEGKLRIALFDTKTVSGIDVIGIAFADETELAGESGAADGFPFGPETAAANQLPYSHTHNLGPPFRDGCSYLYQYGASNDSFVYVCPADVNNIRLAGTAMGVIMAFIGLPIPGAIGYLVWNAGINLFQQNDGSLKFYTPGSSLVNHYGWVYWYSNNAYYADWYWYYPQGSQWYCWARKNSNNTLYYVC